MNESGSSASAPNNNDNTKESPQGPERTRVAEAADNPNGWRLWGPYLAERAWGTVREDYSADGSAWDYLPHDHARSKAYRWNEDGIGGISDIRQFLCFSVALWNGADPILKERMFGLSGPEGNHGEDVKELYYHLDATPTASYLKFLYKYPQRAFPYDDLVKENARRGKTDWEYEIQDTGAFDEDRYFDVFIEYAKIAHDDICIRIRAVNRGPEAAHLHLVPTLWFRNTWSWGLDDRRPGLQAASPMPPEARVIEAEHHALGKYRLFCEAGGASAGTPQLLFTENETNRERLHQALNVAPWVKDGIENALLHGDAHATNGENTGTKAAGVYRATVAPNNGEMVARLRLTTRTLRGGRDAFGAEFDQAFDKRIREADAFYAPLAPDGASDDLKKVQRQAFAGLIWSKQYYHYDVQRWLDGDPAYAPPPAARKASRNRDWRTLSINDVLSMPDTWEYPWFAAWDTAFHMIPWAQIDPDFAKHQLLLLCREWYTHPNGQLPAYEWAFGDVNPPVHAWAALRIYKIERKMQGKDRREPGDTQFLERIFHKLLINFTWWVNRKDAQGNNVFEGGFLGLDNIGAFDRSAPLPPGALLEQADGTAWMAMYCLNMLAIALELARDDATYQDVAIKFAEHFVYIAHAMTGITDAGPGLWDDDDGFFYDALRLPPDAGSDGLERHILLKSRSLVGLIPLLAVEALDADTLEAVPDFRNRLAWFLRHKPELAAHVAALGEIPAGDGDHALFALVDETRLRRLLTYMLDETEFLSPHGIRSLSRFHKEHPFHLDITGFDCRADYEPAESQTTLFGGNSNWRGPVWFPINYLLIEALQKYDYVYNGSFKVEYPTGSGIELSLWDISTELSRRLISLFTRDENNDRPAFGGVRLFQDDPHFRDYLLFHEYFHADNGAGLGASHQTGWTALVAKLITQSGA